MTQLHHHRVRAEGEAVRQPGVVQRPDGARRPDAAAGEPRRAGLPSAGGGRGRRRPNRAAVHLAVALAGASGLGLLVAGDRAALAEEPVAVQSASVSVAAELGLHAGTPVARLEVDPTARLGELTASRTAREAEQEAAARAQAEADRLATEAIAEAARPEAVLPVEGGRLTSGFGPRWGRLHAGIDLAAPMRTPEYAAMDGVVLEAGPASGYGLAVYVQHGNGDVTVYGHMDEILVTPGQVVRAGDPVALLGNRGQSTGPHLHFEVRLGGPAGPQVDPVPYLRERGVQL